MIKFINYIYLLNRDMRMDKYYIEATSVYKSRLYDAVSGVRWRFGASRCLIIDRFFHIGTPEKNLKSSSAGIFRERKNRYLNIIIIYIIIIIIYIICCNFYSLFIK